MEKSKILGLRTTISKVGDIENAKNRYANVFMTQPYFDQPIYVGFNVGGYELGLQPEKTPSTDKTESVVIYWDLEDIQSVCNDFIKAGATENEKPYNVGGILKTFGVI